MINPAELHEAAMSLADEGDILRRRGAHVDATKAFARALELERRAAELEATEPSRGILYRSAAWLALEAMEPREAERLASAGLAARDVNPKIAEELRAVMEDARVRLHDDLPPPSATSSIVIELEGPEIGYGDANPNEVLPRTERMLTLLYRSAERRAKLPFRQKGGVSRELREQVKPRLRVSPGSVNVQLTLGGGQLSLWDQNAALVNDLLACFSAMSNAEELSRLIPDKSYRANFLALAGALAPDGARVTTVSLAGSAMGNIRPAMRVVRPVLTTRSSKKQDGERQIEGTLLAGDATTNRPIIKIVDDAGLVTKVVVNHVILEDIVRPCFGRRVRLTVRVKGNGNLMMVGAPELLDV